MNFKTAGPGSETEELGADVVVDNCAFNIVESLDIVDDVVLFAASEGDLRTHLLIFGKSEVVANRLVGTYIFLGGNNVHKNKCDLL